ncbi:hypothetical protein AWB74_08745 [Caballeronia arvi]|uniref:Uncharacterized protein n=1 Tax=Caballeronia arvi TaxID=1777135 RepID=A0A158L791_9BURK|nr:hypothetical protein AWB74_08745 [Caballeronia arvi]
MTTTLREKEAVALDAVASAQRALENLHSAKRRRQARTDLAEAAVALDLIQTATRNVKPYRGLFVQCAACRNLFNDEGSYLAHWRYDDGYTGCISTLSVLKGMGFVVERHKYGRDLGLDYVLGLPETPKTESRHDYKFSNAASPPGNGSENL